MPLRLSHCVWWKRGFCFEEGKLLNYKVRKPLLTEFRIKVTRSMSCWSIFLMLYISHYVYCSVINNLIYDKIRPNCDCKRF